jgi:hypothetical protein
MKPKQTDAEFTDRVRTELDRSVDLLEPDVTIRLRRARHRALAQQSETRTGWLNSKRLLPAVAAAAVLVLFAFLIDYRTPPATQLTSEIEDVEILASDDNPDFFRELDFYSWLVEEMDRAG